MNQLLVFTILVSLSGPAAAVAQPSKIYRLEELTWPQIDALDRKVNAKHFSASDLSSFGMDVHAGVSETSAMLAVRPDLVRSNYRELPSRAGNSFEELRDIAIAQGWQGYLSSPAKATAAHGRALESWWIDGFTDLIVRAIRGEKMLGRPRVPETVPAAVAPVLERALATEAAFEAAFEKWLAQRGPRVSSRASQRQDSASEIRRQPSGSFRFVDPGTNHPIIVWFCRTPRIAPDTRVVFVMHGSESETARQACDIAASYIQSHNAIVLAPQFAEAYYPGDAYVFGNVLDASGRSLPKSAWALTAIERVFDVVRDELGLSLSDYDIVGFSGGAQFVHRLALFVPDARYRRAVAASAGRYAFPSWAEKFPFGLAGSPIDRTALTSVFSRELVVLLGDRDVTDRERDSDSMAQGKTRFARGLRFFATALDEASALGINLRWTLRIVHGVDHSPTQMVRAALEELDRQP